MEEIIDMNQELIASEEEVKIEEAIEKKEEISLVEEVKTIDQLAREVIDGLWGDEIERVEKLTAAGYNANKVQNKVNKILNPKPAKKQDDIIYYTVQKGDSLSKIARAHDTTWSRIYNDNKDVLSSPSDIYIGQQLKIKK